MSNFGKYMVIPMFCFIVILAMYFIYSNVNSVEKFRYYQELPSWQERITCYLGGGAIETQSGAGLEACLIDTSQEQFCQPNLIYFCHYR